MESGLATLAERRDVSSPEVCLGFDLGAPSLDMAVPGLNSVISAGAQQHGHWIRHAHGTRLWLAADLLDTLACREAGPGARATATVAVPGWFGALDRAVTQATFAGERHSVALVTTTLAAAIGWQRSAGASSSFPAVLCLDPDVGISASVVVFEPSGAREVAIAAVPPRAGLEVGASTRVDVIAGLVGHVLRLARVAGVLRIDTALAFVSSSSDPLADQWPRLLSAVTPYDEVPARPITVLRRDVVAVGAVLAQRAPGSNRTSTCVGTVPHRLGVIVETERGLEVLTLVAAGQDVPVVVERTFAADGAGPIRFDLVEARRPGATDDPADWEPVASAHWVADPVANGGDDAGLVQVDIQLSLDVDGVAAIGPAHRWRVDVGRGAVDLVTVPTSTTADLLDAEPAVPTARAGAQVSPGRRRGGSDAVHGDDSSGPTGRSLAWPEVPADAVQPAVVWPPPTSRPMPVVLLDDERDSIAPRPVVLDSGRTDEVERRAKEDAAAFIREVGDGLRADPPVDSVPELDDEALEEIATAEIGARSLAAALDDLERRLSRHFGITLGIRSVPALLDCDDEADLAALRAGAARLEAALAGQPDDELTASVHAAVRAARRTFADESLPRFVGGSTVDIAADAVAVVDHLRLMVGDIQPVERRRLLLDARLRGLSARSTDALVDSLVGPAPDDAGGERAAPQLVRDGVARVGAGHRGWSLEVHVDQSEVAVTETRSGIAQIRLLLLEPCGV